MTEAREVPRRRAPCRECPWRLDAEPGQFPAERYEALRDTSGERGREAPLGAPMFACHKSPCGAEMACAGWLAVEGGDHLGVRLAVIAGRLDPAALAPGADWPALHRSYGEMAAVNGARLAAREG